MDPAVVSAAIELVKANPSSAELRRAMREAGPQVRTLFAATHMMMPRVMGSPASLRSLRSRIISVHYCVEEWTMMLNLNPSEMHLRLVFRMHGRDYTMVDGRPGADRPSKFERWTIVASDPVAVATVIQAYIRAFTWVFLGWDMDKHEQHNPRCAFGVVRTVTWKYEAARRGGKHAHGQVGQPANTAPPPCAGPRLHQRRYCRKSAPPAARRSRPGGRGAPQTRPQRRPCQGRGWQTPPRRPTRTPRAGQPRSDPPELGQEP